MRNNSWLSLDGDERLLYTLKSMKNSAYTLLAAAVLTTLAGISHAATISDPNIFNPGSSPATANSSSEYNSGDAPSNAVDLGGAQFFFNDGQAGGTHETLSLTNFSDPEGINLIRFYDTEEYEQGRLAKTVSIYTSTSVQTSTMSSDYTFLGTFNLATMTGAANTNGLTYTTPSYAGTSNRSFDYYDQIPVNITSSTKSILLDFGPTPGIGYGFTEIQGFSVPEPSTYAMMLASLTFLGFCIRRKGALIK